MATRNFPSVNTSCIYAFGFNDDDADWHIEDACCKLQELGFNVDRHRGQLATRTRTLHISDAADADVEITITCRYHGGYYEGACFDYDIELRYSGIVNGYYEYFDYDGEISPYDVTGDNWYNNAGLSKLHALKASRRVNDAVESLKALAEDAFRQACICRLACVGIFGDGSAIYEDLDTVRGAIKAAAMAC